MKRWTSTSFLAALAACATPSGPAVAPASAPPPPQDAPMTQAVAPTPASPVQLDWSLAKGAQGLELRYTLKNGTDARIWVADQLTVVQGSARSAAPGRVVVARGDAPDTVRFALDAVEVDAEVAFDYPPLLVPVEAGASREGVASVPLPLSPWHNYAPADPLAGAPAKAVLEIAWLPGEGEWGSATLADGSTVSLPQIGWYMRARQIARGMTLPLP